MPDTWQDTDDDGEMVVELRAEAPVVLTITRVRGVDGPTPESVTCEAWYCGLRVSRFVVPDERSMLRLSRACERGVLLHYSVREAMPGIEGRLRVLTTTHAMCADIVEAAETENAPVAVEIGVFVRFAADRVARGNLAVEAVHHFSCIMQGRTFEPGDRALRDLL